MKKLFFSLILLALIPSAVSAQGIHFAAGATLGTDTFGAELALPVGRHFAVRGGYGSSLNLLSIKRMVDCNWANQKPPFNGDVALKASIHAADIRGLLDFYPWKGSGFHISAGAYYGHPVFLQLENYEPLPMDPSEYGTSGFVIGDQVLVTDKEGYVQAEGRINALKPYVGIGFGRPVHSGGRVSVTFDLGGLLWGSPAFYGFDKEGKEVHVTSESVEGRDWNLIDRLAKIPVCPVLRFNVYFKLF